jgi:antitoxin component YwqK of YwqJK toxin-antitoxin module
VERYEIADGILYLIDDELGISIQEAFESAVLREGSYYLGELLHGPSVFYGEDGGLLACHWFYQGKRHGKGWQYYASGKLYSLERHKEGKKEGKQEYYYEDGSIKTILHYLEGVLDKEVLLFWPNGKCKREVHFTLGRRKGWDRIWLEDGQLKEENYAE